MKRDVFIGREPELRALVARHRGGARLISIVAAGGVGKTTLARRLVAGDAAAVFVDLTEARNLDDVTRITAGALDVSLVSSTTAEEAVAAIGRDLAARATPLLVLDNFEQVLAAAPAVGAWTAAAPQLCVVVTSRERLRLPGEEIVSLQPFSTGDPEPSFASDAVELFVVRAEAVGATIPRDPDTLALIASIAQRLDGIPLAIELAAARANVLGPRQILERLERNLADLGRAPRDEDERHTTMRAAIAWSWELLDDGERSALAQASVFRGGFSADAAEAVIVIDEPVLDVLARLVEKSLLNSGPSPLGPGEVRLGMFATVRDFASEKLGDARAEGWRRHAEHTLASTEVWAGRIHGAQGAELSARLALEEENLLAVVERSRGANGDASRGGRASSYGLRALLALEPLRAGQAPGPYLAALDQAIAGIDETLERDAAEVVAEVLVARAQCKRWAGRAQQSVADLERALAIARAGGSARAELKALAVVGALHVIADRIEHGLSAFERARELAVMAGESRLAARLRLDARTTEHRAGRISGVDAVLPMLPVLEAEGDVEALAHARTRLGMFLIDEARHAEARDALEASLAFFEERRDRKRAAWVQRTLASLDHIELDLEGAERNARQALAVETTMGLGYAVANGRLVLGSVLFEAGRIREAEHELRAAAEGLRALNDGRHAGVALARLGATRARAGDSAAAARAFAEAEAALAPLHDPRLLGVLEIERGHLDLLRARQAREAGSPAADHLEAARRRLGLASDPSGISMKADTLTEAVLATRALRAALAELSPPPASLVVSEDGSWFRPPHGKPVHLANRPTLARVLKALLDARLAAHGDALGVEALTKAGWPGQQIIASAAQNRINVALTTLRKLGLGELVVRVEDGWLLDRDVPVIKVARAFVSAL